MIILLSSKKPMTHLNIRKSIHPQHIVQFLVQRNQERDVHVLEKQQAKVIKIKRSRVTQRPFRKRMNWRLVYIYICKHLYINLRHLLVNMHEEFAFRNPCIYLIYLQDNRVLNWLPFLLYIYTDVTTRSTCSGKGLCYLWQSKSRTYKAFVLSLETSWAFLSVAGKAEDRRERQVVCQRQGSRLQFVCKLLTATMERLWKEKYQSTAWKTNISIAIR